MLGTLLNGRYRIVRVLGSGGFGQTYVAEDTQQPARSFCVVKQFKPLRQDSEFLHIARRLFFNEAETLRKLGSHDQIPALLADFEENHEFYLVQEYVEGQPLSEELATVHRLTEPEVVALLRDGLQILEFVHRHQVIHRDIKPSNLMRRQRDGKLVLIDFGAVKEIQTQLATDVRPTNYTIGIGTHGYGPSEQLMGNPRYSSDLYALGMTAIEALTNLQPAQLPSHPETGEVIWRDQAQVSPKLAAILDKMVRYHFNQRFQSASEVLRALDQPLDDLTEAETELTWIPKARSTQAITQPLHDAPRPADANQPPHKLVRAAISIGLASLAMTGFVWAIRQIGWLQPLEVATVDRMVQLSPDPGPDPRLLVVGITDADIQRQQRFPLADQTIAQLLKTLQSYKPRVIGLDLLRDIPQEPGRQAFLAELRSPNVITIMNLGNDTTPATPAPPGVPPERVGFNDFVLDNDGVIRRNLLAGDDGKIMFYSFSLRLALAYLQTEHSFKLHPRDETTLQLGQAIFQPLEPNSGGYQSIDALGYQTLLKYRGKAVARQISLTDVLNRQVQPEWVKDKVVLVGTTATSARDLFFTPYSSAEQGSAKMAGVLVHAHMVSQFLSAVLNGEALFWFWPEWIEAVWIAAWAVLGGSLAWGIRHPIVLGLSGMLLLLILAAMSFGIFLQLGWVPIAAPALAATASGGLIVAYQRSLRLS